MADSFLHHFADDFRLFSGLIRVHKADKKVSKPANEHVSKQDGRKLRKFDLTEIRFITKGRHLQ